MAVELFKPAEDGSFESVIVRVESLKSYLDAGYLLEPVKSDKIPAKRGRKPKVESDADDEG